MYKFLKEKSSIKLAKKIVQPKSTKEDAEQIRQKIRCIEKNAIGYFKYLPQCLGVHVLESRAVTVVNCAAPTSMFNIIYGGLPLTQNESLKNVHERKKEKKQKKYVFEGRYKSRSIKMCKEKALSVLGVIKRALQSVNLLLSNNAAAFANNVPPFSDNAYSSDALSNSIAVDDFAEFYSFIPYDASLELYEETQEFIDTRIKDIIGFFRGHSFTWWIPPSWRSKILSDTLLRCGFLLKTIEYAMLYDLSSIFDCNEILSFESVCNTSRAKIKTNGKSTTTDVNSDINSNSIQSLFFTKKVLRKVLRNIRIYCNLQKSETKSRIQQVVNSKQLAHFLEILCLYDENARYFYEALKLPSMLQAKERLFVGYDPIENDVPVVIGILFLGDAIADNPVYPSHNISYDRYHFYNQNDKFHQKDKYVNTQHINNVEKDISSSDKLFTLPLSELPIKSAGIFSLITHPDKKRLGFGTQMAKHLIETAREQGVRYVTVSTTSNNSLFRLYKSLGFEIYGQFDCFHWRTSVRK
jgi:ribosomal protein S18 acetylase RimI-like enzyme